MISFGGQEDSGFIESKIGGEGTISMVLEKWGSESIEKLRDSLRKKTSGGTTAMLEQSLVVLPVQVGEGKYLLTLQGEEYWKFVNKGVQGKGGEKKGGGTWENKGAGSPFKFGSGNFSGTGAEFKARTDQWANAKGANPFVVRQSIFMKGTRPTKFYDDVMTREWIGELVDRIERSGAKEIELILTKDFKNGNN